MEAALEDPAEKLFVKNFVTLLKDSLQSVTNFGDAGTGSAVDHVKDAAAVRLA